MREPFFAGTVSLAGKIFFWRDAFFTSASAAVCEKCWGATTDNRTPPGLSATMPTAVPRPVLLIPLCLLMTRAIAWSSGSGHTWIQLSTSRLMAEQDDDDNDFATIGSKHSGYNVLGTELSCCCSNVRGSGIGTGFYRNGFCGKPNSSWYLSVVISHHVLFLVMILPLLIYIIDSSDWRYGRGPSYSMRASE